LSQQGRSRIGIFFLAIVFAGVILGWFLYKKRQRLLYQPIPRSDSMVVANMSSPLLASLVIVLPLKRYMETIIERWRASRLMPYSSWKKTIRTIRAPCASISKAKRLIICLETLLVSIAGG
jgi:hypothetical protein